jgi:hypothetical protein
MGAAWFESATPPSARDLGDCRAPYLLSFGFAD